MCTHVLEFIRRLPPSGSKGFEGLVKQQLEFLTGRRFYLAQSGAQSGRDMTSDRQQSNVMAVECKMYDETRTFDLSELQGKLAQVEISIPDLDLWILATTRSIPDQVISGLRCQVDERGIKIIGISPGDGNPSSIELICACEIDTTISFLNRYLNRNESRTLRKELNEIKNYTGYKESLDRLKKEFNTEEIGYDNTRRRLNELFIKHLRSAEESQATFLQILNVEDSSTRLIERRSAWNNLDGWLSAWPEIRKPFVLHGEEGDGKTWAVASWLSRSIKSHSDFPLVIFIPSKKAISDTPHTLLTNALVRQLGDFRQDFWANRLSRWLKKPSGKKPVILLILDGINECKAPDWWIELINAFATDSWRNQIAMLITCRTPFWNKHIAPLRSVKAEAWQLPPFDDEEMDRALAQSEISRSELSMDVLKLIRKPRYFDMVVQHRSRMEECGDVTVPRLLYEDWRDRLQRRTRGSLDDDGFQNLIKDLATAEREGRGTIRFGDLEQLLPHYAQQKEAIEELCSGGILKFEHNRYRIDDRLLPLGFGLLLAKNIADAAISSNESLAEVIATWMEPQREMDIKASICESAAIHALLREGFPENAQCALLKAWIECHNPECSTENNFSALMPLGPRSYVNLAEEIWTSQQTNPWAEELVMRTFLRWRDSPKIASIFVETFERWMGFVHPEGFFFQRGPDNRDIEKTRRDIIDRIGHEVAVGDVVEIAGCRIRIIDKEGFLRLRLLPLAIISHLPRAPYIHAFSTACLAEAIMGHPQNGLLTAWVLRSSPYPIGEEVRKEASRLAEYDSLQGKRAAYLLLSFEGSAESLCMRRDLPEDLFFRNWAWELYEKDPCTSFFAWQRKDCETCLRRRDLKTEWIARRMQSHCLDPDLVVPADLPERLAPLAETIEISKAWDSSFLTAQEHFLEEIEPALCAYVPGTFGNLIRRIVVTAQDRQGMALRQLSFHLEEFSLILGSSERSALKKAWHRLHAKRESWTEPEEVAEFNLFTYVLDDCNPNEQLCLILDRPQKARDLIRFEKEFRSPEDWDNVRTRLATFEDETVLARILWFLTTKPAAIPEDILSQIALLATFANTRVRVHALEIVLKSGNERCLREILKGQWAWEPEGDREENHWGSLIFCTKGIMLPYSEIRLRVHPSHLGIAIEERGLRPGEVQQYAQDIHRIWKMLGSKCPDIPPDFPAIEVRYEASKNVRDLSVVGLSHDIFSRSVKFISRDLFWGGTRASNKTSLKEVLEPISKERLIEFKNIVNQTFSDQAKAGNTWFALDFWGDKALFAVVAEYQNLLAEWMEPVLRGGAESERLLLLGQSFYEALFRVLLRQHSPHARALYRGLRQTPGKISRQVARMEIAYLDYLLFLNPDTAEVKSLWQERLKDCKTDRDLLEVVMASHLGCGEEWIWSKIEEGLRSDVPLDRARSLVVAGFIESERARKLLELYSKPEPEAWLDCVAAKALDRWNKCRWAKHWYRRFLTNEDDIKAWAAFRLFLCCADSRFWYWRERIDSEIPPSSRKEKRLKFVEDNAETIAKRAEKNEEDYRKTFLNTKIMTGEVSPWM